VNELTWIVADGRSGYEGRREGVRRLAQARSGSTPLNYEQKRAHAKAVRALGEHGPVEALIGSAFVIHPDAAAEARSSPTARSHVAACLRWCDREVASA
jgi:hypothetical protein